VGGRPGRRWHAAAAAAAVFLFFCVFSEGGLVTDRPWGDVGHYETFARQILDGRIPYHDFSVEYPPLALPVFVLPAIVTDTPSDYLQAFKLLMALCGLVTLGAVAWSLARLGAGREQTWLALGVVALAPVLLGHVFLNRYDPWQAMLIALAVAAYLARRAALGSAALAASVAAKTLSAALVPIAALRLWRTGGRPSVVRGAVAFAVVSALVYSFFAVVAFGGLGHSYWVQAKRGLQGESLVASLLLAADSIGVYDARIVAGDPGSLDLGGTLPELLASVTTLVSVAAVLWVVVRYLQGPESDERLVVALAAAATAFLVFAKVISPQYLTWLLPLVPLVPGLAGRRCMLLLAASLLLTQVELRGWEGLGVDAWAVWTLLVRNLLLVLLFALLARELAAHRGAPAEAAARRGPAPVGAKA
jgi:glycosyl transferase family 87